MPDDLDWPNINWHDISHNGRWQLTVFVLVYALIVYLTNRLLITSPQRLRLVQAVEEEKTELQLVRLMPSSDEARRPSPEAVGALKKLVDKALDPITFHWPLRTKRHVHPMVTVAKVLAGTRCLHAAQRLRVRAFVFDHVAIARLSVERLSTVTWPHAASTAAALKAVLKRVDDRDPTAAGELGVLVTEGLHLWFDHDDERLEREAEAQRRTMWLVTVGLFAIFAVGLTGHRTTLLYGALGGFLAPLTRVWQKRVDTNEHATSWGILLLSPIAGALAAYAGLLLVRFLADDNVNVLSEYLRTNTWDAAHSTTAMALALLFGFSAPLFGNLAAVANKQIEPPGPPPGGGNDDPNPTDPAAPNPMRLPPGSAAAAVADTAGVTASAAPGPDGGSQAGQPDGTTAKVTDASHAKNKRPPPEPDAEGLPRLPDRQQPRRDKDDTLDAVDTAAADIDAVHEEGQP